LSTPDNIRAEIAGRLRTAREAAGLSQGQVAKILDLHRPTVTEIEAGRRKVSGEELTRFAALYRVGVEWLTGTPDETDAAEDRILLAARELSKMKDQDLDQLMSLLQMIRKTKEPK
jgi:transcriptional regulator with XRE-family HTH domain